MADILLIHGTWTGGWIWKGVRLGLAARGHNVLAPTLTGLGEREHLLSGETGLDTHIEDLLAVARFEALQNVLLVAHSYGGMLASALADRLPGLVSGVILMNAALPRDGETMLDMQTAERRDAVLKIAKEEGEGYLVPKRLLSIPASPTRRRRSPSWRAPATIRSARSPSRSPSATAWPASAASCISSPTTPRSASARITNGRRRSPAGRPARSAPRIIRWRPCRTRPRR